VPSPVLRAAKTSEGTFAGEFMSDGVSPNMFEGGAGAPVTHSSTVGKPQIINGECESPESYRRGAYRRRPYQKAIDVFL
jgi:hypothetical protein